LLKCESAVVSSAKSNLSSMSAARLARVAIGQLRSTSNKHANLINVAKCAGWAKKAGADMLFLPECLGFMGDNAAHTLEQADPPINICDRPYENQDLVPDTFWETLCKAIFSPDDTILLSNHNGNNQVPSIVQSLQFIARESGIWISGGGVHTRVAVPATSADEQKIYNTHVIIDSSGRIKSFYHKIHLFDVSIPNQVNLQESKTTEPGTKLEVCDSPLGKLGLTICYDMRFSEMYVDLLKMGAQILLVPSAFTVPTGKAHWHALLRGEELAFTIFTSVTLARHLTTHFFVQP
jgi:predicted amidohydrolase